MLLIALTRVDPVKGTRTAVWLQAARIVCVEGLSLESEPPALARTRLTVDEGEAVLLDVVEEVEVVCHILRQHDSL